MELPLFKVRFVRRKRNEICVLACFVSNNWKNRFVAAKHFGIICMKFALQFWMFLFCILIDIDQILFGLEASQLAVSFLG